MIQRVMAATKELREAEYPLKAAQGSAGQRRTGLKEAYIQEGNRGLILPMHGPNNRTQFVAQSLTRALLAQPGLYCN